MPVLAAKQVCHIFHTKSEADVQIHRKQHYSIEHLWFSLRAVLLLLDALLLYFVSCLTCM